MRDREPVAKSACPARRSVVDPGGGSAAGYRPDVDGLRAVAVLAVILFHLDTRLVPGGFAGVDVFFAISGFLITRNILLESAAGRFRLGEFYGRRVKRIALPMLAVVGATVAAAQAMLLPEDALRAAWSGLWAVASLANVYFWRHLDGGYVAADSRQVPLLHLWSLGVEEQFYLLWPALLTLALRLGGCGTVARDAAGPGCGESRPAPMRPWLVATIAAATLGSFVLGEFLMRRDTAFAFYMLPTRAGELLVGGLAAIAVAHDNLRRVGPIAARVAGWCGAAMVVASLALFSDESPFPGLRAMAPTLGAALLLLAGERPVSVPSRLLSSRPLVAIGLVSYSAYLWHWPLLAFYRYGPGEIGWASGAAILGLTFVLARASWRWIEQPARRSTAPPVRVLLVQYALPAAVVGAIALTGIMTGGFGPRALSKTYRADLKRLRDRSLLSGHVGLACDRKMLTAKDTTDPRCLVGPPGAPEGMLLWGDSNAAHYVGLLESFACAGGFRFRNLDTYGCAPMAGDPSPFIPADRVEDCIASQSIVLPSLPTFPVIALAAVWQGYGDRPPFLEETLRLAGRLAGDGHLVILLGKVPTQPGWDRRCVEKALSFPFLGCPTSLEQSLDPSIAQANARLREFAGTMPGVEYFDPNDLPCDAHGHCSAFDTDGQPLYFDASHLTLAGSRALGDRYLRENGLPPPFDTIAARLRERTGQAPAAWSASLAAIGSPVRSKTERHEP